jgi:hypothetical protein
MLARTRSDSFVHLCVYACCCAAVFVIAEKSLLGGADEHSALYTVSDAKIPATGLGAYIANEISSNVVAALAETAPKSIAHIQVGASPLNISGESLCTLNISLLYVLCIDHCAELVRCCLRCLLAAH